MNKILFFALALTIFSPQLRADTLETDLPKLRSVTDTIYRGGRPTENGIKILQQKGFKTIINLEDSASAVATEITNVAKTSLREILIPFASLRTPQDSNVKAVLDLLNDPGNYPIYIHCQHGEDRTGLLVGLYRVAHGMAAADAYKQMLDLGFHQILFPLNHYFEKVTGFED